MGQLGFGDQGCEETEPDICYFLPLQHQITTVTCYLTLFLNVPVEPFRHSCDSSTEK